MKRRDFLWSVSAGSIGALVAPGGLSAGGPSPRPQQEDRPIWAYQAMLAVGVGVADTALLIKRWFDRVFIPDRVKKKVDDTNALMAAPQGGNFSDLTEATVYGGEGYFFYTAIQRDTSALDGFNACMPFVQPGVVQDTSAMPDLTAGDPLAALLERDLVTMVEGPSLVAMAMTSQIISGSASPEFAGAVILPRKRIRGSAGSFEDGYIEGDEYESEIAVIRINYEAFFGEADYKNAGMTEEEYPSEGRQAGLVTLTAYPKQGGDATVENSILLYYPSS